MAPLDDKYDFFGYPKLNDDDKFKRDDIQEWAPKVILILIVCSAAVILIAVITNIICYCCAGCALYERHRSRQQHTGGVSYSADNPHGVLPHRQDGRPPPYPVQGSHVYQPAPHHQPISTLSGSLNHQTPSHHTRSDPA